MASAAVQKAALPLFLHRIAITIFLGIWVVDKFVRPEHTVSVFEGFYGVGVPLSSAWIFGVVQGVIVLAFLAGFMKKWSYLIVFLMHAVTTLVSWNVYLQPFQGAGILFYAAIPVMAALWIQFVLRDLDTITVDDRMRAQNVAVS